MIFAFNRMGKDNDSLHLWWDIKIVKYWIVVRWRKGLRPYCYYSNDATPPCEENNGKWLFGKKYGLRD